MSINTPKYDEIKNNFIGSLLSVDREQLTEFINQKGKEPKKIKPFICLPSSTKKEE